MNELIKIKIIYDTNDEKRQRTCFWKVYVEVKKFVKQNGTEKYSDSKCEIEFVSISDGLASTDPFYLYDLFNNDKTDIIIINWDAINSDPIFKSDITFNFFNHYNSDLDYWLRQGGILIIEAQTAGWELGQEFYNIFTNISFCKSTIKSHKEPLIKWLAALIFRKTDPSVEVCKVPVAYAEGLAVYSNTKLIDHPILEQFWKKGGSNKFELNDNYHIIGGSPKKDWFPKSSHDNIFYLQHFFVRERAFTGWFTRYSELDWDPIFFSSESLEKPIMLCKKVEPEKGNFDRNKYGCIIISTMYLGRFGLSHEQLLTNIFNLPNRLANCTINQPDSYFNKKYKNLTGNRTLHVLFFLVTIIIVFIILYFSVNIEWAAVSSVMILLGAWSNSLIGNYLNNNNNDK